MRFERETVAGDAEGLIGGPLLQRVAVEQGAEEALDESRIARRLRRRGEQIERDAGARQRLANSRAILRGYGCRIAPLLLGHSRDIALMIVTGGDVSRAFADHSQIARQNITCEIGAGKMAEMKVAIRCWRTRSNKVAHETPPIYCHEISNGFVRGRLLEISVSSSSHGDLIVIKIVAANLSESIFCKNAIVFIVVCCSSTSMKSF